LRFGAKRFEAGGLNQIRERAKVRRSARNINFGCQRNRLTGVRDFGLQKLAEARFDSVSNFVQHRRTLRH
jgi:hypothetical protein